MFLQNFTFYSTIKTKNYSSSFKMKSLLFSLDNLPTVYIMNH